MESRSGGPRGKLIVLLQAAVLCAASAAWAQANRPAAPAGGAAAGSDSKAPKDAPPPPVTGVVPDLPSVIVVPPGYAGDETLAKGCWVQFFDDKGYGGRSLTLVGPVEMPKMNIPGGLWVNWSSAVVGPNATVTTFDYEQFQNPTAVLRPGQRVPDLKYGKLGLFEDIHSVRIACQRPKKKPQPAAKR